MFVFVCFGVSYEIVFVLCISKKSRTVHKTKGCLRTSVMSKKIREIEYVNFSFHEKKLLVCICSLLMFICVGLGLKTSILMTVLGRKKEHTLYVCMFWIVKKVG